MTRYIKQDKNIAFYGKSTNTIKGYFDIHSTRIDAGALTLCKSAGL